MSKQSELLAIAAADLERIRPAIDAALATPNSCGEVLDKCRGLPYTKDMPTTATTTANLDAAVETYMSLGFTREEACERALRVAFEAALAAAFG